MRRVVIDAHIHGVTAVILQPPYEPGNFVGKPVHTLDIVDKFTHPRVIERITDPRDVELSKMADLCRHAAELARRAARRFPELHRGRLPLEGVVARPVTLEMLKTLHRFLDARSMSRGHPPHHEIRTLEVLEPFRSATIETFVNGLINETLQGLDAVPD